MDVRTRLSAALARPLATALLLAAALALLPAAPAPAAEQRTFGETSSSTSSPAPGSTTGIAISSELPGKPEAYELHAREAIEIANQDPKVAETRERYGELAASVEVKLPDTWQIGYFADGVEREIGRAHV